MNVLLMNKYENVRSNIYMSLNFSSYMKAYCIYSTYTFIYGGL